MGNSAKPAIFWNAPENAIRSRPIMPNLPVPDDLARALDEIGVRIVAQSEKPKPQPREPYKAWKPSYPGEEPPF